VPLQGAQRVAFAPGGTKAISIGDLTTIWLWDVHGKEAPVRVVDGGKQIQDAVFLPSGKALLHVENWLPQAEGRLKLTPLLEPGRADGYLEGTVRFCFSIAVSPNGRQAVSGSNDGMVVLWDLPARKVIRQFDGGPQTARRVAFTADGRRILLGSGLNTLMIWDAVSGERLSLQSLPLPARGRASFAFASAGRRAVIGSSPPPGEAGEHVVLVWDLDSQKPLQRFTCDTEISCVEISADGQYITAGCDDTTIRLWRLEP
jgi:WD40 repeat protein